MNRWLIAFGKSDNSKLDIKKSSVLRIASEEINKYDNEDDSEAPWYRGYINIVMQEVPEKSVSDSLDVFERLSRFQPRRIRIEELARLKNEKLPEKLKSVITKIHDMSDEELLLLAKSSKELDE